jgi:predicted Zn-dependent protease/Tfp pilus assembly protein PilF
MKKSTHTAVLALIVALCMGCPTAAREDGHHAQDRHARPDAELQQIAKLIEANASSQAEQRLKTYLSTHADSVDGRLLYAGLLYSQARYFACIDQCRKIVTADAQSAEAWHHLGNAYQQVHKPENALAAYKKYVSLSADTQPQYQTLINLLEEQVKDRHATIAREANTDNYLNAVTENGLFRWSHTNPITVFINSGDAVPSFRPEFEEALRQAFEDWSEATDHKFAFAVQEQESKPDITVTWTNDLHAPEFTAEAGDCRLSAGPDGLTSAKIRLLTVDPFKEAPLGKEALHAVCLHEIGHALGLQGHSGNESDIMFPILKEDSVSPRDRQTLFALYSPDLKVSSQLRTVDAYGRQLPKPQLAQRYVMDGSSACVGGDFKNGRELLEKALQLDPSNQLARSNLAVCANNLAIVQGTPPEESIRLLYEALYWQPDYETASSNLLSLFPNREHPKSFAEHVKAAEERAGSGDMRGAVVEYRLALQAKADPGIQNKINQYEHQLASGGK